MSVPEHLQGRPRPLLQTTRQPEDAFYLIVFYAATTLLDGSAVGRTQRKGKTDCDCENTPAAI